MPGFKRAWVFGAVLLGLSACGSKDACDRPQEYVYSKSGQKLILPEGMTAPDSSRNQTIPPLSGERKERSNPCSVLPPELVVTRTKVPEEAVPRPGHGAPTPARTPTQTAPIQTGTAVNAGPLATLNAWIDAWSKAEVADYLAYYSVDYRTPGEDESRESWLQRRTELIESTGPADITIRDITFEDLPLGRKLVRLIQDFNSADSSRSVVKIMELVPEGGGFRIRHEWVVGFL